MVNWDEEQGKHDKSPAHDDMHRDVEEPAGEYTLFFRFFQSDISEIHPRGGDRAENTGREGIIQQRMALEEGS